MKEDGVRSCSRSHGHGVARGDDHAEILRLEVVGAFQVVAPPSLQGVTKRLLGSAKLVALGVCFTERSFAIGLCPVSKLGERCCDMPYAHWAIKAFRQLLIPSL